MYDTQINRRNSPVTSGQDKYQEVSLEPIDIIAAKAASGTIEAKDFDSNGDGKIAGTERKNLDTFIKSAKALEGSGELKKGTLSRFQRSVSAYASAPAKAKSNVKTKTKGVLQPWIQGLDIGTKVTLDAKEKITQMVEGIIKGVTGASGKETAAILNKLGKAKGAAGLAQNLGIIANEMNQPTPNKRLIASKLLGSIAEGFNVLPAKNQDKLINGVSKFLSKTSARLRPFAGLMTAFHKAGAAPEALKFVAAIIEGKSSEITKNLKDLGRKLSTSSPKAMGKLMLSMVEMLPKKVRAKVMARVGLRKVSVVGTVFAATADAVDIGKGVYEGFKKGSWRTFWRGLVGLGSTACGVVPGVGTAASAAIDIGLLAEDVSNIASKMSKHVKL